MKIKKIRIVLLFLVLMIIGLIYALYLYNKPFISIENTKPKIVATAQKIITDFQTDEQAANKIYVDQLILFKGKIADISFKNGISTIILKDENNSMSSIICQMLPEANLNVLKLKKNDQIVLKGICTGYLLDIIMVKCILTNDSFNEK